VESKCSLFENMMSFVDDLFIDYYYLYFYTYRIIYGAIVVSKNGQTILLSFFLILEFILQS